MPGPRLYVCLRELRLPGRRQGSMSGKFPSVGEGHRPAIEPRVRIGTLPTTQLCFNYPPRPPHHWLSAQMYDGRL